MAEYQTDAPPRPRRKRVRRVILFGLVGFIAGPLAIAFVPFLLASAFESLPVPNQSMIAVILVFLLILVIAVVCYFLFAHIQTFLLVAAILGGIAGLAFGAMPPRPRP
jgi:hypothetical protein